MIQFQNPFRKGQTGLMLLLIFNTILLGILYFVLPSVWHFTGMPLIYAIVGGGMTVCFVIYNKGFTRRVKPENLPKELSAQERQAWSEEGNRLLHNSRWMLTVIIPILLIFLADILYLFFGQIVLGWFQ